jgi:hypothetical protein
VGQLREEIHTVRTLCLGLITASLIVLVLQDQQLLNSRRLETKLKLKQVEDLSDPVRTYDRPMQLVIRHLPRGGKGGTHWRCLTIASRTLVLTRSQTYTVAAGGELASDATAASCCLRIRRAP